ncbi:hypothetical protein MAR_001646 [Mya arenaria]|uniref:Uncharacterized protein n=1 Tax=Mya arenaria TaxID=6604 RepID=A0ABY7FGG0_MYAAR|nr:hypothetical protein MAR_001646 [Mya arenaria]
MIAFFTTNPTIVKRVFILPGISDHDNVQIQVNTSVRTLFQKPRTMYLYKKSNWDRMIQELVAYHQEMLESDLLEREIELIVNIVNRGT